MGDRPDKSEVLSGLNNQIMTLASGILALAATFATGIIGKSPSTLELGAIGAAAVLLLLSVCCALVANAKIIDYLRAAAGTATTGAAAGTATTGTTPDPVKQAWNKSAAVANLGFFLFAAALLFLLGFAALRLRDAPSDVETAVRASTDLLIGLGKIKSQDEYVSFTTISKPGGDEIEVRYKSAAGVDHVCTVVVASGEVRSCS